MSPQSKNSDLHGSAPDTSSVALLLMDVINDFEYEDGDRLLSCAKPLAPRLKKLKSRAKEAGIPVIYVNDNFGRWQSDLQKLVEHCLEPSSRGRSFVELLKPDEDDYFVLKSKHSGFYGTTLALLLRYLEARTLVIAGLTGDMCVLFTAQDAFLRDFELVIPEDCVVSCEQDDNRYALAHMRRVMKAVTTPSDDLDLAALRHSGGGPSKSRG